MGIENHDNGWAVCCDHCGDVVELDVDEEQDIETALEAAEELGFVCKRDNYKFNGGYNGKYKETYYEHTCKDCQ